MSQISKLDKKTARTIMTAPIIYSTASIVKELVENSLDANATVIEVTMKNHGLDGIVVNDNGKGLSSSDFNNFGKLHATSKLKEYSDLGEILTYGFRGEAIAGICASSNMTIITRTKEDRLGTKILYDKEGLVKTKEKVQRTNPGLMIILTDILGSYPVRQREWKQNIKAEFNRLIYYVYSYGIIRSEVKIILKTEENSKSRVIFSTNGKGIFKETLLCIYGVSILGELMEISLKLNDNIQINGFISKLGFGKGSNRHFYFLNKRPVHIPDLGRILNKRFKENNQKGNPMIILNIIMNLEKCEINVTPDKRTVMFRDEEILFKNIMKNLGDIWDEMDNSSKMVPLFISKSPIENKRILDLDLSSIGSPDNKMAGKASQDGDLRAVQPSSKGSIKSSQGTLNVDIINKNHHKEDAGALNTNEGFFDRIKRINNPKINKEADHKRVAFGNITNNGYNITNKNNGHNITNKNNGNNITNKGNIQTEEDELEKVPLILPPDEKAVLERKDLERLRVIGQFNKGFILTKLPNMTGLSESGEPVYIIDQHAADEKRLYEKYLNELKIGSQDLFSPKFIHMSVGDEIFIMENIEVINNSMFRIGVDETRRQTNRIYIKSVPVVYRRILNENDFKEYIDCLIDSSNDKVNVIIPKILRIIASKSCREAVMIGDSLNRRKMEEIVIGLSVLKKPWSCPHGRPTIRFLTL